MAVVKPFRSIRYNLDRFEDMRLVVSQPYDRIDHNLQDDYYRLSPYNVVRIILGKREPADRQDGSNVYTRALDHFRQWMQEGVLVREAEPAFYVYEQSFTVEDQPYVRLGLIAAVELTDFEEGTILPHERIHAGPKEDRLRLLNVMQTNTEQIFILYPDDENRVNALIRQTIGDREPDIDLTEIWESDVRQRLWIVNDRTLLDAIQAEMAPKRGLIIADGHHRYSTGLSYRDQQRAAYPGAPVNAAFNFVQATLVSMTDPGLVVLPTHREICNFTATTPDGILRRAQTHFTVNQVADLRSCLDTINAHPSGHAFGFYGGHAVGFHVLTLKRDDLAYTQIAEDHSKEWKSLSVSILHKILLEQIAGVPEQGIEDKSMVRYHRDPQLAVQNVTQGKGNFVFFVSATRMDQIKAVANQGEKMPQKSTDFYPKVISGLSMLPLNPNERL